MTSVILAPAGDGGSCLRLRWDLRLWLCPVEAAWLQETLEGCQGWETAAGVNRGRP